MMALFSSPATCTTVQTGDLPACTRSQSACMQEIDELFRIFRVLGTPTEASWPGVSALPDYRDIFPRWAPRSLAELVPALDPLGLDVLAQMLQCALAERSSAGLFIDVLVRRWCVCALVVLGVSWGPHALIVEEPC